MNILFSKDNLAKLFFNYSLIFILVFIVALSSLFITDFLSLANFSSILLAVSQVGIVACSMMFCLSAGDVDLSVGAIVAFAGVFCAVFLTWINSPFLAVAATLIACGALGLFNGYVVAYLKINALITTLATMQIVRGLAYITSGGNTVGIFNDAFFVFGTANIYGISAPVIIMVATFIVFGVLLNRTIYGRNTLAIGGNPQASRLAGINVALLRTLIFTVQGVICGVAGVVLASRFSSGQPTAAVGFELDVISACVLGGVSLSGGVARISGMIVAVLIIGIVQNVLDLENVGTFYQYIVRGTILILALLVDQAKNKINRTN